MPQAIPWIASYVWSAVMVGAITATTATVVIAVATTFIYAAGLYLLDRAINALTPRPKGGRGYALELNYAGTAEPRRIIYGSQRVGGMQTIPGFCSGDEGKYLHFVLTIAGHEVNDINNVYFDNTTIADGSISAISETANSGKVNSGTFANLAWIRRYLGTAAQTRDYILNQAFPSAFGTDFRGRGIAYAAIQLKWNKHAFASGIPNVTFDVQGKKTYDPRDLSTVFNSNPALAVRDFLVTEIGFDATEIDDTLVSAAANICDQLVNIPGPATQKRYTCNVTLFATETWEDNLRTLVDTMHGRVIWRDGKWRIYAGAWDTPSFSITKNDWVSATVVTASVDRNERWNAMRLFYVDPNRNWQRVECFPRRNTAYETADGGDRIWREAEVAGCTNEYEAQRHAELYLRQGRNQLRISGMLRPEFIGLCPSETVTLSDDEYGWSSKTFRVVAMDIAPNGGVSVVLVEEGSATWTDMTAGEYDTETTAATIDPGATLPGTPLSLVASGGRGYIDFSWQAGSEDIPGQTYRLIEGVNSANATAGTEMWRGLSLSYRLGKSDTTERAYWVQGIVDSYLSAYQPNTFGLLAVASTAPADGTPGTYAPALTLTANGQQFRYSGSHTNIGVSTIEFNAVLSGVGGTAAMYAQNYRADGTALNSYNLSGTGNGPRGLHINSFTQNNSTAYCTVVASVSGGYTDRITVVRLMEGAGGADGSDALVGYLTNENHTLVSSSNGFVPSYAGASGAMVLMLGVNSVNVNSITFSTVANPQVLTHVFSTNGTFAVTAGFDTGEDLATLTLRGAYNAVNVDKVFSLAKAKGGIVGDPGADGADAQFLALYATSQQFRYSGSGTNIGVSTIGFTAFLQNIAGTAGFYANNYLQNGTLINSVALAGAGNSDRGFHINSFTQGGSTAYAVIVSSISGGFNDRVTVVRLQEGATGDAGADAIVGYLTNEAHTVPASSNGAVTAYDGATGQFFMFEGINPINTSSITFASSEITPVGLVEAITAVGCYSITGGIGVADALGMANFRGTYKGVDINKVFTVTKAVAGVPGGLGPVSANLLVNGQFEKVDSSTGRLAAWDGVSTQHTYGDLGIDGSGRMLICNSRASQINVFNEFWIPVTPLMEALEVGVWLRAPTSGQQVRLLIDARDIYKTPVNAQRSQIHGFVNFFQGYSAGATSVRVCKPTGTAGDMGWVGWNGGGDDYLMVPRKITRSNSWGCGTEIFGFHRNTMVETAIQIDSSGMGATSYDTMILSDGLPYGVSTRDWMGIGHGGYTYRTWPSASVTVSSKWTRYTIVLRGENSPLRRYCTVDGQNEYTTLYPGTSQVRFGIGANYGGVNGPLYVDQFVVRRRNYQPLSEFVHDPQGAFGGGAWTPMHSAPSTNTYSRVRFSPTSGWSGFGCIVVQNGVTGGVMRHGVGAISVDSG